MNRLQRPLKAWPSQMARGMESTLDPCTLKTFWEQQRKILHTSNHQCYKLLAHESCSRICPLTGKAHHESFLQAEHILMNADMSANIMKILFPTEQCEIIWIEYLPLDMSPPMIAVGSVLYSWIRSHSAVRTCVLWGLAVENSHPLTSAQTATGFKSLPLNFRSSNFGTAEEPCL